jgi:isopropylmalate/homocitrate/citramalate synthase
MSELIWTGSVNDRHSIGGHVGLYDTTLRDGEQTVGVVLDPQQKLEIARLLDELGIDRIEAGFPRVSDDDWEAVRLIAADGLRVEDNFLITSEGAQQLSRFPDGIVLCR